MSTNSQNNNFEAAMSGLEEIVTALESGKLTLDESIEKFEEALALTKICEQRLADAKGRVRILIENADGSVTDGPFTTDDET